MHLISLSLALSLITALAHINGSSLINSKMTFWNLQRKVWDEVRISSTHEISGRKRMEKIKKVIATFYLTFDFFFLLLAIFISHNSEGKKVRIVR